jgi:hypothetical protein
VIHFLPQQLAPFGCDRKGAVMEIAAQVAQGITDASPIFGAQWFGAESHGAILPGLPLLRMMG